MRELGTFGIYVLAALAEIGGCFAVWSWSRNDASAWWLLPGALSLAAFAWILTRSDMVFAGRSFAAYGGVYIVASLGWLILVEHGMPTEQDMVGVALCLIGAALILSSGLKI